MVETPRMHAILVAASVFFSLSFLSFAFAEEGQSSNDPMTQFKYEADLVSFQYKKMESALEKVIMEASPEEREEKSQMLKSEIKKLKIPRTVKSALFKNIRKRMKQVTADPATPSANEQKRALANQIIRSRSSGQQQAQQATSQPRKERSVANSRGKRRPNLDIQRVRRGTRSYGGSGTQKRF